LSTQSFQRGTVGMARGGSLNSANSQFFIDLAAAPWLDGQYTVIGNVISGMDVVDKIKKGAGQSGQVTNPDRIIKATVGG
jgi:cyclophilin family peptidyl-prolyl cis-trans isomerase